MVFIMFIFLDSNIFSKRLKFIFLNLLGQSVCSSLGFLVIKRMTRIFPLSSCMELSWDLSSHILSSRY
jgi:hypothetical protein